MFTISINYGANQEHKLGENENGKKFVRCCQNTNHNPWRDVNYTCYIKVAVKTNH